MSFLAAAESDTEPAPLTVGEAPARQGWTKYATAVRNRVVAVLAPAAFAVVVWWIVGLADHSIVGVISTPTGVLHEITSYARSGNLATDVVTSLREALLGWAAAVVAGGATGLLASRIRVVRYGLVPIVEVMRPISPIAWLGPFVLWFGVDLFSKAALIFVLCFFTVFVGAFDAGTKVDPSLVDAGRMLGSSRLGIGLGVIVPASFRTLSNAARFSITAAWGGTVIVEMIGASSGVGYRLLQFGSVDNASGVITVMLVVGAVGVVLDTLIGAVLAGPLKQYR
ncbi:MAG TPA: ABC transporter permease subunit [Acidimicrobiales bacterium]|nr:ABC transporter permease subunit [Acidimicrobiales bacterium]